MSDDIFSKLFELFDQPGPVNWKLGTELARRLAGPPQPVDPWAADELKELARLAERRVGEIAPFPVPPAPDAAPMDPRAWVEANIEPYGPLVEPFAASVAGEGEAAPFLAQMGPAIIGLQAGSLVGSLSAWVAASFEAGLPQARPEVMSLIVSNIEAVEAAGADVRSVRLWAVANEVSFRAVSQLPWIGDRLAALVADYAEASQIDPGKLSGLVLGGADPTDIERSIEGAGGIEGFLVGEEAEAPKAELEAFLGAITGCARLLARRAVGDIAPDFDLIASARDAARPELSDPPAMGVGPVPAEITQLGDRFNQEVERRYGETALAALWAGPSLMPSALELGDPTTWAARALLDGWS